MSFLYKEIIKLAIIVCIHKRIVFLMAKFCMLRWRNFFLDVVGARVPNKLTMFFCMEDAMFCYTTCDTHNIEFFFRSNKISIIIRDYCLVRGASQK